jgi:hypothetical protein
VTCAGGRSPRRLTAPVLKTRPVSASGSGFFDQDQFAPASPAHRPSMAGIDWVEVIAIAALVISAGAIGFVVFAL